MTNNAAQELKNHLYKEVGKVVFGMEDLLHGLVIAWIANGHVLLQGVPGLGKTLLAKTFAQLLSGSFGRIQGTADLMPSDITGLHIFNAEKNVFEFIQGPLFNDVVLVDEINRTGPKTQSALLQAMEENIITLDRKSYPLAKNFFLIAAQNPFDFEGVYPLLESQLDRFLVRLNLTYPAAETEATVLRHYDKPGGGHGVTLQQLQALPDTILHSARAEAAAVHVEVALYHYVINLAQISRNHPKVSLGLSTRGTLSLMRCARVEAALAGRDFMIPDDIKAVAPLVVGHRLLLTSEALLEGFSPLQVFQEIEAQVAVPTTENSD